MHRLLLIAIVVRSLLSLVEEEPRSVRAMRHRLKLGREIGCRRAVKHLAIRVHHAGHVKRLLVAPFDLDGVHARRPQRVKMREHVHILRVHDERAAVVFLDGKMLARTLLLLERVAPAAGLRAVPAVARAAGEIGADETAPRDRHAHGTVRERLDFHVCRHVLAHAGDIVKRHLPRAHHAARSQAMPHARRFGVGDGCLG